MSDSLGEFQDNINKDDATVEAVKKSPKPKKGKGKKGVEEPPPEPEPEPEPEEAVIEEEPDRKIRSLRRALITREDHINMLAKPLDRHIVNLYETFSKVLAPDRSARIERKFKQITMMSAEELEVMVQKRKHIQRRRQILKREKKKQMESAALKEKNRHNQNVLDYLFCRLANHMADQILNNEKKKDDTVMPEAFKRLYDCALANVWRTTGIDNRCDAFDIKVCHEIAKQLAQYVNNLLFETTLEENKYNTIKEMN